MDAAQAWMKLRQMVQPVHAPDPTESILERIINDRKKLKEVGYILWKMKYQLQFLSLVFWNDHLASYLKIMQIDADWLKKIKLLRKRIGW